MDRLYSKSPLNFAIAWIVIYCVTQSLAINLSHMIGIDSSANLVTNIILSALLYGWIRKNRLMRHFGLCRSDVPSKKLLWYIPLALLVSHNLWNGVVMNMPLSDTLCYVGSMLFVGFLEEVIFRGLLYKAMEPDGARSAVIVSSVTFGIGHILNLVNGSGMSLLENLCQIAGAIAIGFLFVMIFRKSGSIVPCIIAHSLINSFSAFMNGGGMTAPDRILFSAVTMAMAIIYAVYLIKIDISDND